MLISPPFLPARAANESEADWLDRCMAGGEPGDGAYPLSFNLGWHGGMHLVAPGNGTSFEAVRAIADGTVVFRRPPTPQPAGPLPAGHPQAYHGGWTDNGVVVIRHDTEIGEGANAEVRFFSIYMHLREIAATVSTTANGGRISRKAEIGQAGQVYGSLDRKLHFEIVCDDDNLRKLVGRAAGDLNTGADGRVDALYGEMYVQVPAGAAVYGRRPLANSAAAMMQPPTPQGQPRPAPLALQPVHTTAAEMIVGLRCAGGEGTAAQRAGVQVTSYRLDGSALGAALTQADAEYELYDTAGDISEAYPAATRPAPSAVYELLRYGRVVGPDALAPADVPHWREVRYDGGQGWINLNAAGLHKFSDADFPHWKQWRLIDDSADRDSRCDSTVVRGWLDASNDGRIDPIEAVIRLSDADVRPKLDRAICKFSTEWDAATVDARWGWLKTRSDENAQPLDTAEFEALRAHIGALAFWPGGMGLPAEHWHFQPREFVRHFRPCRWLAEREMKAVYPNATAANITRYRTHLNVATRKYLVASPIRLGHFYGQAAVESAQLRFMSELYNGDPYTYFRHYAKAKNFAGWLGNVEWNDGGDFRGRGFKQMTGRDNYARYWVYRGWLSAATFSANWWRDPGWWGLPGNTVPAGQVNTLPTQNAVAVAALVAARRPPVIGNPDVISTDAHNCIDTAGWFWAKNTLISTADTNDAAEMTRRVRGDGANVGVTTPWPAAAHFPDRQAQTTRIITLLGDRP
ncbi:hydroxyethylthiazole kinase [Aquabacterium sp.]|uniref:hydroxyethylthiazole kinase n=1 Tax=Aquabacterium sp. TaxID=1872578 RepID=UPI002C43C483|nr:hydroxyethylthiazole kinase [Aquabacterium sp.]HSW08870.1 hydroxyethylthiazole kinase [Aquabacterium sp.]